MNDLFHRYAVKVSALAGSPLSFMIALGVLLVWALTGSFFGYSDTWQLVINTGTTIVTFLMVFLIQNTQNRDAKAIQLKLDELLRGLEGARNSMVGLENLSEEELDELEQQFLRLRERYKKEPLPEAIEEDLNEIQGAVKK